MMVGQRFRRKTRCVACVQMGTERAHPRAKTPFIDASPHHEQSQSSGCAASANQSVVCLQNNVFDPQSSLIVDCNAGCNHKRRQLTGRRLVSNRRTGSSRTSAVHPGTPWTRRQHLLARRTVPAFRALCGSLWVSLTATHRPPITSTAARVYWGPCVPHEPMTGHGTTMLPRPMHRQLTTTVDSARCSSPVPGPSCG